MKGGKRDGAGRPQGIPNKTTSQVRECFSQLLYENIDGITEDIKKLEPKDRLKVLIELAKFVLPSLKAIEESDGDAKSDFKTIIVKYSDEVKPI